MKRFAFRPGQSVRINGVGHVLLELSAEKWRTYCSDSGEEPVFEVEQLLRLYVDGELILVDHSDLKTDSLKPGRLYEDLTSTEQRRVQTRVKLIGRVDELLRDVPQPERPHALLRALKVASSELERDTLGRATYFRWKALLAVDPTSLAGRFRERHGRRLPPRVREIALGVMHRAVEEGSCRAPIMRSMQWIDGQIRYEIAAENTKRAASLAPALNPPGRSSLYKLWNQLPAYDRSLAKLGAIRTRAAFRSPSGRERPLLPLDLVEYDGTRLPMVFFDEETQVVFGRPWLSWYLDNATDMPTGIYLGFEHPGDLTAASALRHACLPKTYVQDAYPDIENKYLACGIARRFTFDNERMAHGRTIGIIAHDLWSNWAIAPSHTPWFKSRVEGMFNVLNLKLLQELPGFTIPPHARPEGYDPANQGCIGIRYFLYLLHHWLIDLYCQAPTGRQKLSPAERWRRGAEIWPPDLLSSAEDLDLLFGIVRKARRLDHRGIVFRDLYYYSPEIDDLRRLLGDVQLVKVKINPTDLGLIHIRDERNERWLKALPLKEQYARGLSLHRHTLNQNEMRRCNGDAQGQGLEEASARLSALIAGAFDQAIKLQTAGYLARAIGVGTQNIFNNVGADGRLPGLSGPFEGQPLNPFSESDPSAPEKSTGGPVGPEVRARSIPDLPVDRSLSGRTQ